jgi:hypothetical protein
MESGPRIEITKWRHSPQPLIASKLKRRRYFSPALCGFLGTMILHAVLFQTVQLSSGMRFVRTPDSVMPASQGAGTANQSGLVLVGLTPSARPARDGIQNITSQIAAISALRSLKTLRPEPIQLGDFDSLPIDDQGSSNAQDVGTDTSDRNRLFGIYTGQIYARISRLWRRPRTEIGNSNDTAVGLSSESFRCEAQIIQDATGYVQEILLPRCNGNSAWKQSLLTAIRQASPLPAPPDTTVFTPSITLSFVGVPYSSGALEDEYEIVPKNLARAQ